ncbi:MAG: FAD-dependent oxidoreductase [Gammaproteobacteria bacterium]
MTDTPHELRVAVVGSGPSGFYAAEALLKAGALVDVIERLPCPFGLVRSGVAPDHPKLKTAIGVYEKIARHPGFNYIGNVTVGRDLTVQELRESHHAVVFCHGAESDRRLGVPGEDLPGSHTATEFVGWYNGHPDYRDRQFDLSQEIAVIVGQGNVAADVARILCKTADELRETDISAHALDALAASRIREIHVVGRRGPAQAKFTSKELKEFGEFADCRALVEGTDLELDAASAAEAADKSNPGVARNLEIFRALAAPAPAGARVCRFRFLLGPRALRGGTRVEAIDLEHNRLEGEPFNLSARGTGRIQAQPCGIVFRSIGYRGTAMAGLPFDERAAVVPNRAGAVLGADGEPVPGLYTAGWIKRGPTGIIGTNRADAVETVESLLADRDRLTAGARPGAQALYPLLASRGVRTLNFADWSRIDAAEVALGKPRGKPREKFTRIAEMLAVLDRA